MRCERQQRNGFETVGKFATVRDLICGQEVFYKDVFSPSRFSLGNIPALLAETGHSIKGLGKRVLFIPGKEAEDILPGQAGVVLYKGKKAGVYKDMEGKIYAVDIRCPHLGCQLEWNAAELSRDLICGQEVFYKDVFSPSRFSLGNIPALLAETGHSIKGLGKRVLFIPGKEAEDILPGQAGVVLYKGKKAGVYKDMEGKIYAVDIRCPHLGCQLEWNAAELSVLYKGKKAGVYKDMEGKIYAVDIRCPHLGCQLEWNAAELSWDCPCHGSRFDYRGNLLSNPAQKNI